MKKNILSAVAAMAGLPLFAAGFDGLSLQTNDWFDAAFSSVGVGTAITSGSTTGITRGAGSWTAVPSDGIATNATDGSSRFISLLTEPDDNLTFTPAPFAVTSGYETVVANIKAEVTDGDLTEFEASEVQAAFCIKAESEAVFAMGHTLTGWTNITYTAASTAYASIDDLTNGWFTLYMDFAKVDGNRYVRYSVKPDSGSLAVLTDSEGVSWFRTVNKDAVESISFTGTGLVKTFSGDELTKSLEIGSAEFTYYTTYQCATTVVASVTGLVAPGTGFSLSLGGNTYSGTYTSTGEDTGSVTFYNVDGFNIGETVDYTISATGTTSGSAAHEALIGNLSDGWIVEDRSHSGSGAWTDSDGLATNLVYSESSPYEAGLDTFLFTPTNAVGDAVVTVVSDVIFGGSADTTVDPDEDSYAAVRFADVSGTATFQVWVKATEDASAAWVNVYGEAGTVPEPDETVYAITSKFDFFNGTCSFYVGDVALTNATGVGTSESPFYLASDVRKMSSIKFYGKGGLVSLNGSFVEGAKYQPAGTTVTVDSRWVAEHMSIVTTADATTLLAANSDVTTNHCGTAYNYFQCYALGIDPANEEEAPFVSAAPTDGGLNLSLSGISVPEGVTLSVQLTSSSDGRSYSNVEGKTATAVGTADGTKTSGNIKIDVPEEAGVKRYKMSIGISASE